MSSNKIFRLCWIRSHTDPHKPTAAKQSYLDKLFKELGLNSTNTVIYEHLNNVRISYLLDIATGVAVKDLTESPWFGSYQHSDRTKVLQQSNCYHVERYRIESLYVEGENATAVELPEGEKNESSINYRRILADLCDICTVGTVLELFGQNRRIRGYVVTNTYGTSFLFPAVEISNKTTLSLGVPIPSNGLYHFNNNHDKLTVVGFGKPFYTVDNSKDSVRNVISVKRFVRKSGKYYDQLALEFDSSLHEFNASNEYSLADASEMMSSAVVSNQPSKPWSLTMTDGEHAVTVNVHGKSVFVS